MILQKASMSGQADKPAWNKDSKFALKFVKYLSWPLGNWPLDYDSAFSNFRLVFSFVAMTWLFYVKIRAAYLSCGTAGDVVDHVVIANVATLAISKMITFRVHMGKIRTVLFSAMNDWLDIKDNEDRAILKSFAKTGRLVFNTQFRFAYVCVIMLFLRPSQFLNPAMNMNATSTNLSDAEVMTLVRELPLNSGCMFGHYRYEIYVFLYAYETIVLLISVHGNVGSDIVIFSLLMHLCGKIELIKKEFRKCFNALESSTETHEEIVKIIQKHARILDLAMSMKVTASGYLVIQLFCNAGMNLLLGIRVLIALQDQLIDDVVRNLFALGILMLQLYLVSYASDLLCRQSESVANALYDSQWYEMSPKLRKELYFVAMRANQPINLTAGGFYILNLENYMSILKASFSYFSILRVMFHG